MKIALIALVSIICSLSFAGIDTAFGAFEGKIGMERENRMVSVSFQEKELINKLNLKKPTLLIIEGLSSGAAYAPTAKELYPEIQLIHIQNGFSLTEGLADSFNPADYDANIIFTGYNSNAISKLLTPFKAGHLEAVIGSESGVKIYDHISNILNLRNSGELMGRALRDKFLMAQIAKPFLEEVGIETIPGISTGNANIAINWIKEENLSYPIFVKPVESAGSFGGGACFSENDIRKVFKKLIGCKDPLGQKITELIVQPAITGEGLREVVSNGVYDEETGFVPTDFFEYKKRRDGHKALYLGSKLKRWNFSDKTHAKLIAGGNALGKAFKFKNAALHPEFFVLGDRVIFIEVGKRPAGGGMPGFVSKCGGIDQIKMHLLSLYDREFFLKLAKEGPKLDTEGNMMDLLYSGPDGILVSKPTEEDIRNRIPGFLSASLSHMKPRKWLHRTKDLFQSPGIITVQGDEALMEEAEEKLREWEQNGFYQVRKPGVCARTLHMLSEWISLN